MKKGENVFILVEKWKRNEYKSYLNTHHALQKNFTKKKVFFRFIIKCPKGRLVKLYKNSFIF